MRRPLQWEIRRKTNEASVTAAAERCKRSRTCADGEAQTPSPTEDGAVATVTPEDEWKLLRFYTGEIVKLCVRMHFPTKVKATAIMFLKRFYLYNSCINHPPMRIMLTCVYLAGKIEESYIGAEDYCRQLNQDPKAVLNNEVLLLQGLRFDLIVHSPYRALMGLMEDLRLCREQQSEGVDEAVLSAPPEALDKWKAAALSAVDALMLSDAPLQHPPGQLALAALRSALRAHGIRLVQYMERAASRAQQAMAATGEPLPEDVLTQLLAALDDIDRLGMEGAQKVDVTDVQAIDKRLIAYRTMGGDADASKAALNAAEQEKAERREAKLKARREQQAAAEARVLGVVQPQTQ